MTEIDTLDTQTNGSDLELETKVKRRFAKISHRPSFQALIDSQTNGWDLCLLGSSLRLVLGKLQGPGLLSHGENWKLISSS